MNTLLLLLSLLCGFAGIVCSIIALIRRFMSKNNKILKRVFLSLFTGCFASFLATTILTDASSGLLLTGMAFIPVVIVALIISIVLSATHKKPLKSWMCTAVLLAACVSAFVTSSVIYRQSHSNPESLEIEIQVNPDFEITDGTMPIEVPISTGFEPNSISRYRHVYDSKSLPLAINEFNVTAEDCKKIIMSQDNISEPYKDYFVDFIDRIAAKYPDANLAILYHNLKTLNVKELSRMDYLVKSRSIDSYGCYVMPENTIYIPEGTQYIEGEWGFQVLIHEFCHATRSSWFDENGLSYRIGFRSCDDTTLLEESMNSVFSCSLLNYNERDIAYQVPSNYLRIMLECMDNYELSDYINHSDAYFLSKLDECTGYTNYAQVVWKLITLQRSDYLDDRLDMSPEKYEPIYTYLCDLYYDKYITDGMSAVEMTAVADELVEKAFYDAPDGYKIEKDFFYDYLDTYIASHTEGAA